MLKMYFYAKIDDENICRGISQLSGIVDNPELIPIENYDVSLIGKIWTGYEWKENTNASKTEKKNVTQQTLLELNREVLAEILLSQAKIIELMEGGV